jgi:hypothetical protein
MSMAEKKGNCGCGCIGQNKTPLKNPKATKGKNKPKKAK